MFVALLGISIIASFVVAIGNKFRNPVLDGFTVAAPLLFIPFILAIYDHLVGIPDMFTNVIGGLALYGSPIILFITTLIRHFRELEGPLLTTVNFVAVIAATWLSVEIFSLLSAVSV